MISIIVPIYNSEKYLEDCISSIINQTYKDFELILVNDGSIDGTAGILEKWRKSDKRISVYNQKNSGVSAARNKGLSKAVGEYVMFVDSDDYIDSDYIGPMVKIAEKKKADFVITNHVVNLSNSKETKYIDKIKQSYLDITYPKYLRKYFEDYNMSTACKTLFRRSLLCDNNIIFDKDLKYGEDMLFGYMAYCAACKAIYLNIEGYHYRINAESVSQSKSEKQCKKNLTDNLTLYNQLFSKIDKNDSVRKIAATRCLDNFLIVLDDMICGTKKVMKETIMLEKKRYQSILSCLNFNNRNIKPIRKARLLLLKNNKIRLFIATSVIRKHVKKIYHFFR